MGRELREPAAKGAEREATQGRVEGGGGMCEAEWGRYLLTGCQPS